MSNYTEADVRIWARNIKRVLNHPRVEIELNQLESAALEGAKVPGLVADNAALGGLLLRVSAAGIKPSGVVLADVDAALNQPHPGAALLAEHEAKVTALQARVTVLQQDARTASDAMDAAQARAVEAEKRVAELARERDEVIRTAGRLEKQRAEEALPVMRERDALRAQVARLRQKAEALSRVLTPEPEDFPAEAAQALGALESEVAAISKADLSAPPAETTPAPECAVCGECTPVFAYGGYCCARQVGAVTKRKCLLHDDCATADDFAKATHIYND